MARVKGSVSTRNRRKKILEVAKGYVGSKSKLYRVANEQVLHSWSYAFRDRKNKRRTLKRLWIKRINAASRLSGVSYSELIKLLRINKIELNRKILSSIAYENLETFNLIVKKIKIL